MQRKELLKKSNIRYAEYYGMVEVQDALYADSASEKIFTNLISIIGSDANIKMAYRNLKSNKTIMKKAVPYSDIFKLPGLLDEFSNTYSKLLDEMEAPIEEAIDEARKRVLQELEGKLCEGQLRSRYTDRFQELHEKASHCNNVATLQNIKRDIWRPYCHRNRKKRGRLAGKNLCKT